jgi:hypothetical protein
MSLSQSSLTILYVAYLGRVPSQEERTHWLDRSAASIWDTAAVLSDSTEAKRHYPQGFNAEVINQIYQNLFDAKPAPAAVAHWLQLVNSGSMSAAGVGLAVGFSAAGKHLAHMERKIEQMKMIDMEPPEA